MSDSANRVVQKLWSYCHVLRDDGLSYQDYLEQLTQLLFLKMADERASMTGQERPIPKGYRWADLARPDMEGTRLEDQYRKTLQKLAEAGGMLGLIFRKAQNKIQDPAKLRQIIIELIGKEQWLAMSSPPTRSPHQRRELPPPARSPARFVAHRPSRIVRALPHRIYQGGRPVPLVEQSSTSLPTLPE